MANDSGHIEGTPSSQLMQLIAKYGHQDTIGIMKGTVTAPPPNIKVALDGDIVLTLDKDDLIISQHLTKYTRKVKLTLPVSLPSSSASGTILPAGDPSHTHTITALNIAGTLTSTAEGELSFEDELKVGDRVIIVTDDEKQVYYVIDRVVEY